MRKATVRGFHVHLDSLLVAGYLLGVIKPDAFKAPEKEEEPEG